MDTGRAISKWRWWILTGVVVTIAVATVFRLDQTGPHPTDEIPSFSERFLLRSLEYLSTNEALEEIVIPIVDFEDTEIGAAIRQLEEQIHRKNPEISLDLAPDLSSIDPEDRPRITLRLKSLRAIEALRYITDLAGLKFKINNQGEVIVVAFTTGGHEYHTVKYPMKYHSRIGSGPIDYRSELEVFGLYFPEGARAELYPNRDLLVVTHSLNELHEIHAITGYRPPSYWERLTQKVNLFFNPPAPLPADPFASP